MRGGREEKSVLEMGHNLPYNLRPHGIERKLSGSGRGAHVRFIDYQYVKSARVSRDAVCWQSLAQHLEWTLSLEVVNRGDEPWEVCPRIYMYATLTPQLLEGLGINDLELKTKFITHLVSPFELERGRDNYQN